jgi:serine/threonine-protein kinase
LEAGNTLGPYVILSTLGAGGMGEVYRARDMRLDREVAIKVLPEHLSDNPEMLSRFEREAKVLAALSHPNILSIHDFGQDRGSTYAVMELLRGETLRELINRGPVPAARVMEIAARIADGLAAAHANGVVHRDLKPDNVFLTSDGGLKILDFGLARRDRTHAPQQSLETEPGTILGTVHYMSPEQLRGDSADARSDLFSFGCILYEMLTQQRPFSRDTAADTFAAILKEEMSEDSEPFKKIPPELVTVIRRCLAKKRENRFQSASDLSFALKMLSSASGSLRVPAGSIPGKAFSLRRLGAVAAVIALLGIALYWTTHRNAAIRSVAVLPFLNATADPNAEYLSDGLTESIINSLSQLPGLRVMARSTVFHYKGKQTDPRIVGRELQVGAVLLGSVMPHGDSLVIRTELVDVSDGSQLWGREYKRGMPDIQVMQEEISKDITNALRLKLTGEEEQRLARHATQNGEAYQLYLKGRYSWNKRTLEGLRDGIDFFNQAIDRDPGFALAYTGLADSYIVLGGYNLLAPGEAFPKARTAAQKALEIDPNLAEAWAPLAFVTYTYDWNWQEGEKDFRRSLQLNPNYPTAHHWFALYWMAMGRSKDALSEITKAQDLDPLSLIINTDRGLILRLSRRSDAAEAQLKRTLEMDPNFPTAHGELRSVYEEKGRFDLAIAEIEKASAPSGETTTWMETLKQAYLQLGPEGYRQTMLDQALEQAGKGLPVSPFDLAVLAASLHQKDRAIYLLQAAYRQRSPGMTWLKVEPRLDPLRSDPRFIELLSQMKFPH